MRGQSKSPKRPRNSIRGQSSARRPSILFSLFNRAGCFFVGFAAVWSLGYVGTAGYHLASEKFAAVPVKYVDIHGPFHQITTEQIESLVQPFLGEGFFSIDLFALQDRLEGEPWVLEARVVRRWPAGVEIRIEEKIAVAVWQAQALIDQDGQLFYPEESLWVSKSHLPQLEAPESLRPWVLEQYWQISRLFGRIGVKISRLTLNPQMSWRLTLDNGVEVMVDRERMLAKLMQLVSVYPKLQKMSRPIDKIDLRYINGFAVDWGVTS